MTYVPRTVYVVDNGSTDGSPDRVASEFPETRLVPLPSNRGFGGGMNAGIDAALVEGSDFVLCLNNDMTVDPGFLEPLLAAARARRVVPYPAIYQREDAERIDNVGSTVSYTGLTGMIAHGSRALPGRIEADYTEVPLLTREMWEDLGGWSEEYFAFYEDVDLSLRIAEAGWRLVFVPESRIYHKRGRTTRRVPGLVSYYSMRNRLLLARDHAPAGQALATALHALFITLPFHLVGSLSAPETGHSLRHLLLGLVDGLLPWRRGVRREWQTTPG